VSSIAGIVLIVVLTPVQGLITKAFAVLQKRLLKATDARLDVATEMLGAIKTVKFWAWEDQVLDRMSVTRSNELAVLRYKQYVRAGANILIQLMPPLVTVVTFYFYTVVYGNQLDASTAFTSLALFSMLRVPLQLLLETTTTVTNAWVSCQRLDDFLNAP
jgi:ABC-type bacteriocin/lantibiotic exporter with double-glycine peptidase domain